MKVYFIAASIFVLAILLSIVIKKDIFSLMLIFNLGILTSLFLFKHELLLLILTLMSSFTVTYLIENMGLSDVVRLVVDYFILLIGMRLSTYFIKKKIRFRKIYILIILFLVLTIISFFVNRISIQEYVKKLYFDYFRYFVILLAIINFDLKEKQIKKIIKWLWYLLLLQIPIVILQNIWSINNWQATLPGDIRQDYLSGILGGRGNTELGLIITIALTTLFILYINKKINSIYFILSFIIFTIVLIIGETKFIFFILPITLGIVSITKLNIRSISMILISLIIIAIGIKELGRVYSEFNNFANIESIEEYSMTSYAGSGISRGDSFIISNKMIKMSFATTLVGYGVGNATSADDTVSKPTQFQKSHGYRFTAFNIAQYIIELGYIGLMSFYGIFLAILFLAIDLMKNTQDYFKKCIGSTGISAMFVIIMSTFYNMSMEKVNFAVFSWMLMGLICRYNYEIKDRIINKNVEES